MKLGRNPIRVERSGAPGRRPRVKLGLNGPNILKNITKVCKLLLGLREMGFRVYVFRFLNYSRTEFV